MNSYASVWHLKLGIPALRCGPSSWEYGLPCSSVAPPVGDRDPHSPVWPFMFGIWTLTLWCGPWSREYGFSLSCVAL